MRGEHATGKTDIYAVQGSSPHARGTRRRSGPCSSTAGIIPACAGNTGSAAARTRAGWDHPRMRGEHVRIVSMALDHQGSSPRARGTLSFLVVS